MPATVCAVQMLADAALLAQRESGRRR